jgi:hypothetical protein
MTAAVATDVRSLPKGGSKSTRAPVEKLVPADILAALDEIARCREAISAKLLRDLDRRFALSAEYGVSGRRLRTFLERRRRQEAARKDLTAGEEPATEGWSEKLRAHRRRQASVASILDATFGHLGDCDPALWERRAYLMLVGLVYERLATNEEELATEELVSLAKVLAEHRRIDARAGVGDSRDVSSAPGKSGEGELPAHFADLVRQVYGTNFQVPG